jgi:N-acetylglucosaminyldiphosphoundecaprenol N-acetyl-beta-D-mannosaminyltransferase
MERKSILNIPFVNTTQQGFIEQLMTDHNQNTKRFIITANPEIVMQARHNPEIMSYLQQADYVTPDGIGVVIGGKLLNKPLTERITGYDTMIGLLEKANDHHLSIYLLGAAKETLPLTIENIHKDYPNITIAGSHHGFFDWESPAIINEIKATRPDFIFVALGVPRQEKWITMHLPAVDHGIFMGVGGSFDVIAGTVKRAPVIWQKLYLEWLYRLLKQPSRFGRMLSLPKFALTVLKVRLTGKEQ